MRGGTTINLAALEAAAELALENCSFNEGNDNLGWLEAAAGSVLPPRGLKDGGGVLREAIAAVCGK